MGGTTASATSPLTIGALSKHTGCNIETIRYYEQAGLLRAAPRGQNGYRRYEQKDVEVLRFVKRARNLGFSVKDVDGLLALWQNRRRTSAKVKALTEAHVADVDRRIAELRSIRNTLVDLIHRCHGDDRPDCPILEGLSGAGF